MSHIKLHTPSSLALAFFESDGDVFVAGQQSEVELYDHSAGFRVPLTQTWSDATYLTRGLSQRIMTPPGEWGVLQDVSCHLNDGWMAAGMNPQRAKLEEIHGTWNTHDKSALLRWCRGLMQGSIAERCVASGVAMSLGDLDVASKLLETCDQALPVVANQQAILLALLGQHDLAVARWEDIVEKIPAAAFNLGIFAKRQGELATALAHFEQASQLLSSQTGWYHLAQLHVIVLQSELSGN